MDLFFFILISFGFVCALCFVYYDLFVCFCILRKTNTVLAQNEFCNKGQRKGKATLVCWASVYYYASSSWYRGKQFTVIFLIFLLFAPESLLYCFMYHTSHTLLSSLFSHTLM